MVLNNKWMRLSFKSKQVNYLDMYFYARNAGTPP